MKHILMIGTGGTIASQIGQDGLRPALTSEQLLCFVPKVSEFCRVDCIQLFSLDSTNIRPENWVALAKAIQENSIATTASSSATARTPWPIPPPPSPI